MDAKKRERSLGALRRRQEDLKHWQNLENHVQEDTDQRKEFARKRSLAEKEISILQARLGVL